MDMAEVIRRRRAELGLSQADLAKRSFHNVMVGLE
jgi:ribosome-binding protein aMBF1 (putative translation factor)